MASILSQYSTTGFYNAPISKGLMGYMFLTCTALNVPALAYLRKYLICKIPDSLYKEVWRIVTFRLAIFDAKDLVFGALLIYYFRIFERRYGSYKFANYLVCSQAVSILLEVLVVFGLTSLGVDFHDGYLCPGPHSIIFSLFVNYYFDIPRVTQANLLGIPVTGKTLTYILGLQLCSSSDAIVSAVCGIVAGLVYRFNFLGLRRVKWIPEWLSRVANSTLNRLLASSPPEAGPIGATLEIQRQEQMEIWEQQMIINQQREFRARPMANGDLPGFMRNFLGEGRQNNPNLAPAAPPSEDQIQTLVEMGFDRQRVVDALQASRNDANAATHVLLQQT